MGWVPGPGAGGRGGGWGGGGGGSGGAVGGGGLCVGSEAGVTVTAPPAMGATVAVVIHRTRPI